MYIYLIVSLELQIVVYRIPRMGPGWSVGLVRVEKGAAS